MSSSHKLDTIYEIILNLMQFFCHWQAVLTSIVLKRNVTMLDIVSTRMLGQFGFLAKVKTIISSRDNAPYSGLMRLP